MKRALVTGSGGFVGKYLRAELESAGYDVTGADRICGEKTILLDLRDAGQVLRAVQETKPDIIIHLAGQASVARSWAQPGETVESNILCAVNLMEAVRMYDPAVKMVMIGSSDEYGALGALGADVKETIELRPGTPYAVTKKAQEEMAQVYVRAYGMNISMTRSFNHGGAGQREGFLIPDFAAGIARVEKGLAECLRVGNLEARRDFTHVKDVVRAYRLIAEAGHPGEIYNVGSGRTYSAREILDRLCAMATCPIRVETDPAKMRPSDTPVICCNHEKLTAHTGWKPQLGMDDILRETLTEWREKL